MNRRAWFVGLAVLLISATRTCLVRAQSSQDETAATRPAHPVSIDENRPISWRSIVPDIARDQQTLWTFPAMLARGQHWKPALGITLALGGLIALDAHDSPFFRNNRSFAGFNNGLSSTNASLGTLLVPASFYAVGLIRKDSYTTRTSLLAGEAVADSGVLAWVLKNAMGRQRPYAVPQNGNYSDTWFETYKPPLRGNQGFPSGHAIAAFSVATIFAQRYRSHRWAPWVAYGAAGLVGFSRVSLQQHFPSDVFAGAAFGYLISRYIVMPGREPAD